MAVVSVSSKRAVSVFSMLEKKGMKDSRESLLMLQRRHLQVSKMHSILVIQQRARL